MNCTVCHKPTTSGSRHPECGALVVSVMEAADRYWDAGSGARYRARDKLEAAVVAAIRSASAGVAIPLKDKQ